MEKGYIVGIDIGASNIYGTIGKADKHGKLKILASCCSKSYGIKKGIVTGIDSLSDSIRSCIAKMETLVNIYIDEVYIGIPTGKCNFISSTGVVAISNDDYEVLEDDIKRVLKNASDIKLSRDKKIVDVIAQSYKLDDKDNIHDPLGMKGNRLEADVKIAVADYNYINDIYKAVEKCSVSIIKSIVQSEGTSKLLLREEDLEETIALVDVGSDSTNIAIYDKGHILSSSQISLGGMSITSDIEYCAKIPLMDSEKIKIKSSAFNFENKVLEFTTQYDEKTEVDMKMINEIIYARTEEIISFIISDLKKTKLYDDIDNVILYGGGISNFTFTEEIWKRMCPKPVFIIDSKSINLENPLTINALGIVKYMYNELKLNSKDLILENDISNKSNEDVRESAMLKIRKFFREYF
ncbi:MAG: cell division protein FtsA [Clostridium sp.]|uniref:cell division protein FtsA n=1 Tax=Clostridium sp. TaxID=1506 RepID=UPI002A86BC94|nr:cell division protein FtsA [Clostridium sp.]MDY5098089.1 cell division protein FtsA [Clostridium sp.]